MAFLFVSADLKKITFEWEKGIGPCELTSFCLPPKTWILSTDIFLTKRLNTVVLWIVTFIINSRILITNPSSCALLVVDRRTADTDTEIIKWLALVIDAHLKYMWNLMNQPVIDKVITKMHRNCIYIDWHTYWHGEVDQKIISEISISSPKNLGIKRGILPVKKIVTYSS